MIPTSRSASFKAMMSLWCFVFFSNFESFSGTGHILSREKITHSWSLRNVRCSLRRLLQLTGNYFQAPLYMVRMSSLFHYRYIVMHTTKDMHIKGGEHWRLSCNLQKRTTNCRRLRASNRPLLTNTFVFLGFGMSICMILKP